MAQDILHAMFQWIEQLKINDTSIPDVKLLEPARFGDERGFFSESWNSRVMAAAGLDIAFVQDNHSMSEKAGTLRGLHFQAPPYAQGKLVRCGRGRLYDVAVDARAGSPTYGHWTGHELSFENGLQLWIPAGFLHGFVTREAMTEIIYKCTEVYDHPSEGGIRFDDPDIGIDWGLPANAVILSERDRQAPLLRNFANPFINMV